MTTNVTPEGKKKKKKKKKIKHEEMEPGEGLTESTEVEKKTSKGEKKEITKVVPPEGKKEKKKKKKIKHEEMEPGEGLTESTEVEKKTSKGEKKEITKVVPPKGKKEKEKKEKRKHEKMVPVEGLTESGGKEHDEKEKTKSKKRKHEKMEPGEGGLTESAEVERKKTSKGEKEEMTKAVTPEGKKEKKKKEKRKHEKMVPVEGLTESRGKEHDEKEKESPEEEKAEVEKTKTFKGQKEEMTEMAEKALKTQEGQEPHTEKAKRIRKPRVQRAKTLKVFLTPLERRKWWLKKMTPKKKTALLIKGIEALRIPVTPEEDSEKPGPSKGPSEIKKTDSLKMHQQLKFTPRTAQPVKRKLFQDEEDSTSIEEGTDDSTFDNTYVQPRKRKKKKKKKRKQVLEDSTTDSDDTTDDSEPPAKQKCPPHMKAAVKPVLKHSTTDSDETTDDSEPPAKRKPPTQKQRKTSGKKTARVSRPRQRAMQQQSKRKRSKQQCPIEGCSGHVINLIKHFQQCHSEIPPFQYAGLRFKAKPVEQPAASRVFVKKKCPMVDCQWTGSRPDDHLQRPPHHLPREAALKLAKMAEDKDKDTKSSTYVTTAEIAQAFATWRGSFEGGQYVDPQETTPKKKTELAELEKARKRIKLILELCCGQTFPLVELNKLKFFGRDASEGGIINALKAHLQCKWGTIKNYVVLVGHFVQFLKANPKYCTGWGTSEELAALAAAQKGVKQSVGKKAAVEMQDLRVESEPIPLDIIVQYMDSKYLRRSFSTLSEATSERPLNLEAFQYVRGNLILLLALTNGKRAGVFSNMEKTQLHESQQANTGYIVTSVKAHKTQRTYGPANIVLDKAMHTALVKFVEVSSFPSSRYVFTTSEGKHMDSSLVNKAMQSAWRGWQEESGIQAPVINTTKIRKTLVSFAHDSMTRQELVDLAVHFDHSFDTATKNYKLKNGLKVSSRAASMISSIYTSYRSVEHDKGEGDDADSQGEEAEHRDDDDKVGLSRTPGVSPSPKRMPPRAFGKPRIFTDEDSRLLRTAVNHFVMKKVSNPHEPITMAETDQALAPLKKSKTYKKLFEKYTESQVRTNIREHIRGQRDKKKKGKKDKKGGQK